MQSQSVSVDLINQSPIFAFFLALLFVICLTQGRLCSLSGSDLSSSIGLFSFSHTCNVHVKIMSSADVCI